MAQSMDTRRSGNSGSLDSLILTPTNPHASPAAERIILAQAEESPTASGKKQPPKFLRNIAGGVERFMDKNVKPVVEKGVTQLSGDNQTELQKTNSSSSGTTVTAEANTQSTQTTTAPDIKKKKTFIGKVTKAVKGAAQIVEGVGGEVINVASDAAGITNNQGFNSSSGTNIIGQLAMAFAPGELKQAISLLQEARAWNKLLNGVYGPNAEVPEEKISVQVGKIDAEGQPIYDQNGKPVTVAYNTEGRELRNLEDQQYQQKTESLLKSDEGQELLGGNKDVTADIRKTRTATTPSSKWCREYNGETAEQIRRECMALVKIKGGVWNEAKDGQPAVNAVAIRGRDFTQGLKSQNSSKTFDDSVFVVKEEKVNGKTQTTVREFRATTESSSDQDGVAKILAKQYIFNESTFKDGKEPCYRVKGNFADCVRQGQEEKGVQQAGGILIHQGWVDGASVNSDTTLFSNVSLGCQALACKREQFVKDFMGFIQPAKNLTYTVADCSEAKLIVDSRRDASGKSLSALA